MHQFNSFLSEPERQHINEDESHSLQEINHTASVIESLLGTGGVIENKVISKLIRAIFIHQSLKYRLTVSFLKSIDYDRFIQSYLSG
jgi:hypothetical protein